MKKKYNEPQPIIEVNSGRTFKSISDASRYYHISWIAIAGNIRGLNDLGRLKFERI